MKVQASVEFEVWYQEQQLRLRAQIDARISRIEHYDHLGEWRYLGEGLSELKWKSGLRIYFAKTGDKLILLLYGGMKNAQKKDISQARKLLRKYTNASY
ncbi:MAG: type II toxin-antitoxin system RelE/ParE family toxin [Deltaproteobacteria bacterium]|nr:type II toxin-antitoxin system RelE/ParE family toxin [Deltaproteobacteria bacterium]